MENKRSERENYNKHGLIVACIVCIIGVCFDMSKVALAGAILLCVVQLVDLIWTIIEIKCKDCKNIKQVFCKCKDIEILNEYDGIDTKFGKCIKCGKYFMINDRTEEIVMITEEAYKKHIEIFKITSKFQEEIEKLDVMAKGIIKIDDNGVTKTNEEKENKE